MAHIEMLPQDLIDLNREIAKHPPLVAILNPLKNPDAPNDLGTWFAEVATYANVAIDGWFHAEEFPKICQTLTDRLYSQRTGVIFTGGK